MYSFTYNSVGLPTDITDPTGIVTHSVYASNGTLTSTTQDYGTGRLNLISSFTYDAQGDAITATDPRSYVTNFTYDADRRSLFTVQPDPDGAGALLRPTMKTTYDATGRTIQTAKGTATTTNGSDFSALETVSLTYDQAGAKIKQVDQAGVTQFGYDAAGRSLCTVARTNPNTYAALPADACALSTAGSYGPDRIVKTIYDAAGQPLQVLQAYGTARQRTYSTYTYTDNGKPLTVKDANGNRTTYEYDGLDRQTKWRFPVTTLAADTSSTTDYESYSYDANGNRLSLRKRDGNVISFAYDNLDRLVTKDIPGGTSADVYTDYDLAGRPTHARFVSRTGSGIDYAYDGAGRLITETSFSRAVGYQYDASGNRTRMTWPDGTYAGYVYDPLNRVSAVNENGATSGVGVLATYAYDDLGRRTSLTRGNGTSTTYGYDSADRLIALAHDMSGSSNDQSYGFVFSPASQLVGRSSTNTTYEWGTTTATVNQTYDGLNRDASIAAASGYDANGNVTNDGARTYTYDVENRLTTVGGSPGLTLSYDPLGRLKQTVSGSTTTQFLYSGDKLIAELDGSGTLTQRYVHGTGTDEPLVWYVGTGTSARHFLHVDRQGSVIAESDSSGTVTQIYSYGPWGENGAGWAGSRFRYTGQIMLPEAQLYHYKARVYDPKAGRFLQTDPIGYEADIDMYVYVGDDPVNLMDPAGLRPGDIYDTLEQAAGAAGDEAWAASQQTSTNPRDQVEYGTRIFQLADGRFVYAPLVRGTNENVYTTNSLGPSWVKRVTGQSSDWIADVHDHPGSASNDRTCGTGCHGFSKGDKQGADDFRLTAFLRTARGLLRYDPPGAKRPHPRRAIGRNGFAISAASATGRPAPRTSRDRGCAGVSVSANTQCGTGIEVIE